jgi:hypothetical protein
VFSQAVPQNLQPSIQDTGRVQLLLKSKKYKEAEECIARIQTWALESKSPEGLKQVHESYYKLYELTSRPALALRHYKLFVQLGDSLLNEANSRKLIQQEVKYNYEKKFTADSVAFAKEKEIKETEIKKQNAQLKAKRNQRYALAGGILLVIVFAGFMLNRFRVAKQQTKIIEHQKHLVEEKQREILDSIRYAKRIQASLLPTEKYIQRVIEKKIS